MFRLNGDTIKQLENIYHIRFLKKYKIELKERILFFVNQINNEENSSFFIFKENNLVFIKDSFFEKHKDELFNFFNPTWLKNKRIERNYSNKEIQYITDMFLYKESLKLKEFLVPISIAGPHDPNKIDLNYQVVDFEKVVFSNKIYRAIRYELSYILNIFLENLYFYKELLSFSPSILSDSKIQFYLKEAIIRFFENFNYEKSDFKEAFKYHFHINDIKDEKKFLILIFKLYYFLKLEQLIVKICCHNNLKYHFKNQKELEETELFKRRFNRWRKKSSRYEKMFKELNQ